MLFMLCGLCSDPQGEEEVLFLEYRKQLKVLFDNIAQLVRESQLLIICSSSLSSTGTTSFFSLTFFCSIMLECDDYHAA